ncbi:DUF6221 family protein [Streptomyces sp. MB22_4]|uniref:DUF6221 family protein n=1 Tax=Streptomyces sp. MB22_4 TaxID=3383120 RepID=UPI0039A3DC54
MDDLVRFWIDRLDEEEAGIRDCLLSDEPNVSERDLDDVTAKRKLAQKYDEVADNDVNEPYEYAFGYANALGEAVRLLAVVYADHPDYRTEWRP